MENSRKPRSVDLVAHVSADLNQAIFPGANLLLGLSGGIDSISLLHVLVELRGPRRFSLRAVHINHAISPNSAEWAQFCSRQCVRLGVPLAIEQVDVSLFRHLGPEGAARAARWAAFESHQADFLLLAQHRDDQAETMLLQLLRGAGPAGLAGMAGSGAYSGSSTKNHADPQSAASYPHARVLRPFLTIGRADIEAFASSRNVTWVEDESNANITLERNFIRHQILPAIANRHGHAIEAMARAAQIQAEASRLLTQLGLQDIAPLEKESGLDLPGLRALGEERARNALRAYCERNGIPQPGFHRLREIWKQLREPRPDGNIYFEWQGYALRRYRGRIFIERLLANMGNFLSASWHGEPYLPIVELNGTLNFKPEEGRGISVEKLRSAPVSIRPRRGGERLRSDPRRPHRTLKNLWQEKGVPPWRRDRTPLIFCGEELVCVPGLGEQIEWRAMPGERGLIISWQTFG
ncbi:MAG: tRNA lysidine(34) synthetase TilS [Burkholderiales bacterium]